MKTIMIPNQRIPTSFLGHRLAVLVVLVAACISGCASSSDRYSNQMIFDSPEAAAERLAAAVDADNTIELEAIFGSKARETLPSGDPVADRRNRETIAVAMKQGWSLETKDSTTRELIIGDEAWPFPIPIVNDVRGWWFDTAAGEDEILFRRIGRNELSTIRSLRAYAIAQQEYAQSGHDGKLAGIFAQQIRSDPGLHNGLYWPVTSAKEQRSPFGEFIAAASAEGYETRTKEGTAPYHGYYFRILKAQGSAAPGGAMDYVVSGNMTRGFAMIAYPAEYDSSGVMTFMVGPDGAVHQADLGPDTRVVAERTSAFNPDNAWQLVQ